MEEQLQIFVSLGFLRRKNQLFNSKSGKMVSVTLLRNVLFGRIDTSVIFEFYLAIFIRISMDQKY